MAMKKNKWYVAQVKVPPDLNAAQARRFIEDLAEGLERAGHRMKGQATKPADYPAHAAAEKAVAEKAAAPIDGYQPLYFCHGKF